jgi:dTDP-4-amino-4,6-dideoxygalactose transaminase
MEGVPGVGRGMKPFDPPLPVVIPPRPARPEVVAARMRACLRSGGLKAGNRWSESLRGALSVHLRLPDRLTVLPTVSGTEAFRLAIVATAGPAAPGDEAALPSFTYPATAEVLIQLGYRLRFIDVDEQTWTMDPGALAEALGGERARRRVRVVVCVDTFGNPCRYEALARVCRDAGLPLVADSAAGLGASYRGSPVGSQADAHALSMSFAKVISAAGAGGAVVVPVRDLERLNRSPAGWTRSALMGELHAIGALDQLSVLEDLVRRRTRVAEVYRRSAIAAGLACQRVDDGNRHSLVHWVTRIPDPPGRDVLQQRLAALGIETRPYFGALHAGIWRDSELAGALPVTEGLAGQVLALPMSSEVSARAAERVGRALEWAVLASEPHGAARRGDGRPGFARAQPGGPVGPDEPRGGGARDRAVAAHARALHPPAHVERRSGPGAAP